MSMLTIRNLDPALKERLRVRAARHGRSMESEARTILADAVGREAPHTANLAEAIRRRFAPLGGSFNQRIASPVAQKIGAVETAAAFFRRRAGEARPGDLHALLARAPDRAPDPGDEVAGG